MCHRLTRLTLGALLVLPLGCSRTEGPNGGSSGSEGRAGLNGAGSSFVNPLMTAWSKAYNRTNPEVRVNYASQGSGAGIQQLLKRTIDFAASDAPMTDQQMGEAKAAVIHIPLVMGAVVPAYNLPEVKEPLKFTGPLLAGIFMGKITKWNDPAIQKTNPGIQLPDTDLAVVHRSDGSGTTFIWADYLSKVSPEWKKEMGAATTLDWKAGQGGKGNEGVAGAIRQTPGAIGYIELIYALETDIPFGAVQNKDGRFIRGSLESVTAAAAASTGDLPKDLRYSITDAPGPDSYPISGTTWAIVYQQQARPVKGKTLVDFLTWVTHDGQAMTAALKYAALPRELQDRCAARIKEIQVGGTQTASLSQ